MQKLSHLFLLFLLFSCGGNPGAVTEGSPSGIVPVTAPSIIILGTVQDGGSPHIGCKKNCCKDLFDHPDPVRMVVSIGIVDPVNRKTFLIEATPDMPRQLQLLQQRAGFKENDLPDGVFVTHAHIGHYTGLMYFGREARGAADVPVYAMPRMKSFLESNGPWQQLVILNNIVLNELKADSAISLTPNIRITPFRVPHRDEYSETVGYRIESPNRKAIFIPDIDKWEKWERSIMEEISAVDYALIDATFFDADEVNNRDIREIPHPFVTESMKLFDTLPADERGKIMFIHVNHTNPLLRLNSAEAQQVQEAGYRVAQLNMVLPL